MSWYVEIMPKLVSASPCSALSSFINKPASGGVTAIHMAALNGHFECVHLLLDLHANIAAQSLTYATSSTGSIGIFSASITTLPWFATLLTASALLYPDWCGRSWKHSSALCRLRGEFQVLPGEYFWQLISDFGRPYSDQLLIVC